MKPTVVLFPDEEKKDAEDLAKNLMGQMIRVDQGRVIVTYDDLDSDVGRMLVGIVKKAMQ